MSDYGRISKSIVKAIADALRFCNGNEAQYTPGQMPNAVRLLKKRLMQKTITQNGTYIPPSNYDGFDRVTVNVESGGGEAVLVSKNITANGNYSPLDDNADGYSSVSVSVPGAVLQTKTATANGTVTPDSGYDGLSSVAVAVPNTYSAADNGKVVSGGQLVAQTSRAAAITQNGTFDTTENNSVTVNVSGGGGGTILYGDSAPTSADGDNGDTFVEYQIIGGSTVIVTVSGGYNGGAVITIEIGGSEVFRATASDTYNLNYDKTHETVTVSGDTVTIDVTPPPSKTGKLSIAVSSTTDSKTLEISPNGDNTSYGYNYSNTYNLAISGASTRQATALFIKKNGAWLGVGDPV